MKTTFCCNFYFFFLDEFYFGIFQHVFDYKDGEIFGCVADIGWITGHSYVCYGPLSNGATTLLFESSPIHPDAGGNYFILQNKSCISSPNKMTIFQ